MEELIVIGNTILDGVEIKTVSGRDLHAFLGNGWQFSNWIQSRIESYGFNEGIDFVIIKNRLFSPPRKEYYLSLDMSKELAMVERNGKGKQVRQYFIECERMALSIDPVKSLPGNYKEALIELVAKIEENEKLEAAITEQAPKVELYDAIKCAQRTYSFSEVAKLISNNETFTIGRGVLMAMLRGFGWIFGKENEPMQSAVHAGLFRLDVLSVAPGIVKKQTVVTADGIEAIVPAVQRSFKTNGLMGKITMKDIEPIIKMIPGQRRSLLTRRKKKACSSAA